jgi:hypothetical protein
LPLTPLLSRLPRTRKRWRNLATEVQSYRQEASGTAELSIWYSTTNSLFACIRDDDENLKMKQ